MRIGLVAALLVTACTKGENAGNGAGQGSTPSGGATSSAVPVPVAAISAVPIASSAPVASAASAAPTDAGPAKGKDAGATAAAKLQPAKTHVDGKNFGLDVASPGCRAGEDCTMTIKLVVAGDYHVNKEYPYKFVASAAPGVAFLGKGDASTFSKASGDFVEEGEKAATMTVRFKASSPGQATIAGTYKMSVCSAEQCQIEQQPIALAIAVF